MEIKKQKPSRKHLHVILPHEVHKEIKRMALNRNVSASKYVIDAVMARIRSDQQYE